jgi:hypothetical protein
MKSVLRINFEECGSSTSLEVVRVLPTDIDDIVAALQREHVLTRTIYRTPTTEGCFALIRLTEQNGLPLSSNRASDVLKTLSRTC